MDDLMIRTTSQMPTTAATAHDSGVFRDKWRGGFAKGMVFWLGGCTVSLTVAIPVLS